MDDFALVLNAGSSSLKFCVYRRPASERWMLEARGQIEGIGTSPRMSVKDGTGTRIADEVLGAAVRDGRSAIDALAGWLRSQYGGSRVLGVGHRVVHGGPRFAAPTIVTPEVFDELRQLVPLAPLHQPHNLAAIEAAVDRRPGVPQVACFDTSFHRGQPEVATVGPLPREIRDEYTSLSSAMCCVRPMKGETAIQATVRKMSDSEAGGCAVRIVGMLGVLARLQAAQRAPKLRAVGED